MGLIRVGSRSHKMTSRQFVRSWLSIWHFPSCDKDGNRNAWPLAYPSGNLTREEPRKRPNTSTASAVDWGNLGTPSSVPTPQLPDSPASRGAGRRGLEAKPGDTGRRAWGYAVRGKAERRTWGQPGMKIWGEDRAARETGPGWRATGEARPGVRSDAGAGWGLTRVLQRLDVLGSGRQLRHHLDELGPGFLVLLEHCRERHRLQSASRGPRAPPSSLPRRGARAYLAAPASDSWRPRLCARHRLLSAWLDRAGPASLWSGQPRLQLGLRRQRLSLCTRVSRATDRNRNAAVSRQPQSPTWRHGAVPGRPSRSAASGGELRLRGSPDSRSSAGRRGSRAPSRVTPSGHRRPPGGQRTSQTEPRLDCSGAGRSLTRQGNSILVRRDKQTAAMESPGIRQSREISHITLYYLINTLLSVLPSSQIFSPLVQLLYTGHFRFEDS